MATTEVTPALGTPAADIEKSFGSDASRLVPDANAFATDLEEEVGSVAVAEAEEAPVESEESQEEAPTEEEAVEAGEAEAEGTESTEEEAPAAYDSMLPPQVQDAYTEELLAAAAKKFGVPAEQLTEKWARDLLRGKIESDILVRNYQALEAEAAGEEETTEEVPATEREPSKPATPTQMMEAATQFIEPLITVEGAKLYTDAHIAGLQALNAAMESGDENQIAAAQRDFTRSQMSFLTVAMLPILKQVLPALAKELPAELWQEKVGGEISRRTAVWTEHEQARASLMKDPRYGADLKKLMAVAEGSKSNELMDFLEENPEVLQKQFVNPATKKKLSGVENIAAQYRFAINAIRGAKQQNPQALVKKGIEAGQKHERDAANKKALARTSPGRSTGQIRTQPDTVAAQVQRAKEAAAADNPLGALLNTMQK